MNKTKQAWQDVDYVYGASFKTPPFAQSWRQTQILILEIFNIFLWLKFSPFLISNKIEHFETGSMDCFPKKEDWPEQLLRSIGGWTVLKGLRKAGIRVKGDERILGDSDFVENVLWLSIKLLGLKTEIP